MGPGAEGLEPGSGPRSVGARIADVISVFNSYYIILHAASCRKNERKGRDPVGPTGLPSQAGIPRAETPLPVLRRRPLRARAEPLQHSAAAIVVARHVVRAARFGLRCPVVLDIEQLREVLCNPAEGRRVNKETSYGI